jgi:hypothetical protein
MADMLDDLEAATRAYRDAQAAVDDAQAAARQLVVDARATVDVKRAELADMIVAAARAGVRQTEIVRVTGYTRESVRRILRAGGVEAD